MREPEKIKAEKIKVVDLHQANTDIQFLKAHDINAELSLTQDKIKYHFNFEDEE